MIQRSTINFVELRADKAYRLYVAGTLNAPSLMPGNRLVPPIHVPGAANDRFQDRPGKHVIGTEMENSQVTDAKRTVYVGSPISSWKRQLIEDGHIDNSVANITSASSMLLAARDQQFDHIIIEDRDATLTGIELAIAIRYVSDLNRYTPISILSDRDITPSMSSGAMIGNLDIVGIASDKFNFTE